MENLNYEFTLSNTILDLSARSPGEVIRALTEKLESSGAISSSDQAWQIVMEREKIRGTGLARGIACPHGKMEGLPGIQVAVARLQQPVDFKAADGILAKHVFLILTGKNLDLSIHLRTLAEIVKCYQSPSVIQRMDQAPTLSEYLSILQACHDD